MLKHPSVTQDASARERKRTPPLTSPPLNPKRFLTSYTPSLVHHHAIAPAALSLTLSLSLSFPRIFSFPANFFPLQREILQGKWWTGVECRVEGREREREKEREREDGSVPRTEGTPLSLYTSVSSRRATTEVSTSSSRHSPLDLGLGLGLGLGCFENK